MKKLYIPGFTFHKCSKRTMHNGKLFDRKIYIPFGAKKWRDRYLRVWVPDGFTLDERIGVIYMVDGQNAVDHNLTAYGEWDMEDHLKQLESEGYPRFIIVGIDCPHSGISRAKEYTPYDSTNFKWTRMNPVHGDLFSEYLMNEIIPLINNTFNIEPELVGFMGSSMGGLFSFHMCAKYPETFKFCLTLSPCFENYRREDMLEHFNNYHLNGNTENRWAFYMGGADPLEKTLTPACEYVLSLMKEAGFNDDNLYYLKDESKIHHESAWSEVIEDLIRFILH